MTKPQKNTYLLRRTMECSIKEPITIWTGPINQCQNAPARSNLNHKRGMGSPQIPKDVGRPSQSSVRELSQSGPSSLLSPFQGNTWSLQLYASRLLPCKSRRTSIPVKFLFQLVGQCQALYQVPEFVSQPIYKSKKSLKLTISSLMVSESMS